MICFGGGGGNQFLYYLLPLVNLQEEWRLRMGGVGRGWREGTLRAQWRVK